MLAPRPASKALHPALNELIAQHPRLGLLRLTHPALVAALATGVLGPALSQEVLHRLRSGDAPSAVAAAAGIAPWLDQLPIGALTTDLLDQPLSPGFAAYMRKSVRLPQDLAHQKSLLTSIRVAYEFGGEPAARWFAPYAAEPHYHLALHDIALMSVCLDVRTNPAVPAQRLVPELDRPAVGGLTALEALARTTVGWLGLIAMETMFGPDGLPDPWRADGTSNGHDIRCVRTAGSLLTASSVRGDLMFYAPYLILDLVRVYEASLGGRFVCFAEVSNGGRHGDTQQFYRIDGLKAGLDLEAKLALFGHYATRPPRGSRGEALAGGHPFPPSAVLTDNWQALMGPLLASRDVGAVLPSTMTREGLIALLYAAFELVPLGRLDHMLGHAGTVLRERHPR
jgi:hypothetical protein